MSNSRVSLSSSFGVVVDPGSHLRSFTGNTLTNNATGPIRIAMKSAGDLKPGTYTPNGVEGIQLFEEVIDEEIAWSGLDTPYVCGGLSIETETGSARLTLNEGVVLKMLPGSVIRVRENGGLTLAGTQANPVTVTSNEEVPQPGDWFDVKFDVDSNGSYNIFQNAVIEYGCGSLESGSVILLGGASLSMTDTTVRHSGGFGMSLEVGAHLRNFTGNTLVDNANGPIKIGANSADDLGPGTYSPNGVEGIQLISEVINHEASWIALDAPYVSDWMNISNGSGSARLTLDEGVVLKLNTGATINVMDNGGLTLQGTELDPVTITSNQGTRAPGDWQSIYVHFSSNGDYNVFEHAVIEYGGAEGEAIGLEIGASLSMDDTIVQHSAGLGIRTWGTDVDLRSFTGNTLINNAAGPIEIDANSVHRLGPGTYAPNGIEGIQVIGADFDQQAIWLNLDVPYVINGGIAIGSESVLTSLTINAGVTLKMNTGGIGVGTNGALILNGTETEHVTITSAQPVPAPGDWCCISFASDSQDTNAFTYTDISYGGSTGGTYSQPQLTVHPTATLSLDNTVFSNTAEPEGCDINNVNEEGIVNNITGNVFKECFCSEYGC